MPKAKMIVDRDPLRGPAILDLQVLVEESGADRAAIMWAHPGSEELHPHVLVDVAFEQPIAPISRDLVARGKAMAVTSRLRTDRVIDKKRGANFLGTAHERDWFIVLERGGTRVDFGPELGYTLERIWVRWVRLMALGSVPYEGPAPAVLLKEAEEVEESGEFEAAIRMYADVEMAASAWGDEGALIRSFLNTGRTYRKMGDWDKAKRAYGTASSLSADIGNRGLGARALLGMANIHRQRGNLPLARETYESSLAEAREVGDHHCVGLCEHGLSYMELSTGNPQIGIVRAWAAYVAYPATDDRVRALSLLGTGWMKVGQLGAAKVTYEIMAHVTESVEMRVLALEALGTVAARGGDEKEFRLASARAHVLGTESLSANMHGQILFHRGESLLRLGLHEEARVALKSALQFVTEYQLGVLIHQVEELTTSFDPEPVPVEITIDHATEKIREEVEAERGQLVKA